MAALGTPGHFWAKVERSDGCWEWRGALADKSKKAPYGRYGVVRAHRKAWELTHGPITNGLHVLHKCDNTLCVNPSHLFLGTPKDNALDKTQKGRNKALTGKAWHQAHDGKHKGRPWAEYEKLKGERGPLAKLKDDEVLAIRAKYAALEKKYGAVAALAKEYRIDRSNVWLIVTRRTWNNLP